MDKLTIYATGNENLSGSYNTSYYIVGKNEAFLKWLGDLLVGVLGIEGGRERAKYYKLSEEDMENPVAKDIKKMIDLHEYYEKKGERVDLFYGKDRVYITFRKSKETRKKFADFMLKTAEKVKITKTPHQLAYRRD
ncbi:MAG: hypothetical protein WCK90_01360 [archaeon]